jgi:hypothetical protein
MRVWISLLWLALAGVSVNMAFGQTTTYVLAVPSAQYPTIRAAVSAANSDTDTSHYYHIQVSPGTYTNDFPPAVTRPMTIEGPSYSPSSGQPCQPPQQVVLKATQNLPNSKGIILTYASFTVKGLTFTGAQITNGRGGNGAGIRDQNTSPGATLMVQNSIFTANQEGILTGDNPNQTVTIDCSLFINNGNPNNRYFQHALYVNQVYSLSVTNSLFCGQLIGHDIKSRAHFTTVQNNRLYDGAIPAASDIDAILGCKAGSTSLAIDTPNGGQVTISGNPLILQGASTQNHKMVDYGEEGLSYSNNNFQVSGNNFRSTGISNATGIYDPTSPCVPVYLSGNTFTGINTPVEPPGCAVYQ